MRVVIDTNVIVSAIQQGDSLSRHLLRLVFLGADLKRGELLFPHIKTDVTQ